MQLRNLKQVKREKKDQQKQQQQQQVILSSSTTARTTATNIECNKPIESFGNYLRISKNLIVAFHIDRQCVCVCEFFFFSSSLLILQWQPTRKVAKK